MIHFFWNAFIFIITLSILIIVHEYGHFILARQCGVQVECFSIGFGPSLCSFHDKYGTKYNISIIPLGGYVKMLDDQTNNLSSKNIHKMFKYKSVWQKIAIIIFGPIFNFIFAILIYWFIFIIGIPSYKPIVNNVIADSIADKAGIISGMEFKYIDHIKTPDWNTVRLYLINKIGIDKVVIGLTRSYNTTHIEEKTINLSNILYKLNKYNIDPITTLGIIPYNENMQLILTAIQSKSEAIKSGLQAGDQIIKVNNQKINSWYKFETIMENNHNNKVNIMIIRHGNKINTKLISKINFSELNNHKVKCISGIILPSLNPMTKEHHILLKFGPLSSLIQAVIKTYQLTYLTVNVLNKLIHGDITLDNINGPISIAQGAITSIEHGLIYYLMFVALISINLGIINLIPLSILDGGHLLFLIIEIFTKRPISEQIQYYYYRISLIVLILLMTIALWNDFSKL